MLNFLVLNIAFASHDWNIFPHNLMLLSAVVTDDPVQKLKWEKRKIGLEFRTTVRLRKLIAWEWGQDHLREVCFRTDLIQATFKSISVTSVFCPYMYFSLHWMIHIDVTFSLSTLRFPPWRHSIAFSTLMAFSILKLHFICLFLTLMLHFLPWCHRVTFSTSMQHFLI